MAEVKRIGELAARVVSRTASEDERPIRELFDIRTRDIERAEDLWEILDGIFPVLLEQKFGPDPTPEWIWCVADLSNEDIAHGLRVLRDSGREFPPNPIQFRAWCRERQFRIRDPEPTRRSEEELRLQRERNRANSRAALARIRQLARERDTKDGTD